MNGWHRFTKKSFVILLMISAVSGSAVSVARGATGSEVQPQRAPLRRVASGLTSADILAELLQHNRLRDTELSRYSTVRTYQVTNDSGKVYATEVVRVRYLAPDHMHFSIASAQGSWLVRDLVLRRLIETEAKASAEIAHRKTSLKPANYFFHLLGEQDVGAYPCYVVQAVPKRADKHLFDGKLWIDTKDYGVVRIAGQPAGRLSFWIESAQFVRQYQRLGRFWFPWKDESVVHMRFAGTKILTIVHGQYSVNGRAESRLQATVASN
jgi:hypothetical protein